MTRTLQPNDTVWYHPNTIHEKCYAAVVDSEPFMCGDTLVVRLRDLDAAYARDHHPKTGRTTIAAACCEAITRRLAK